jgi:hypothetical protein
MGVEQVWRAVAAGVSVVVGAGSGVVTALVTARSSWGLWVALGVMVIAGAVLQAAVNFGERRVSRRVVASGPGAVAVGGSAGEIRTRVQLSHASAVTSGDDGVSASGPGAVSVGGDAAGPVSTEVTGIEGPAAP